MIKHPLKNKLKTELKTRPIIWFRLYKASLDPIVNQIINFLDELGNFIFFFKEILTKLIHFSPNYKELIIQIHYIGIQSIFVVSITGIFVGAIVTLNLHLQLSIFGAEKYLGGLNVSSSFRELTPLLISFIIASKVGVFTTAELGAMKISDEIDTLRSLSIDPIRYLIVPRFLGVLISSFSLLIFGLFMSFIGGLMTALSLGINSTEYVMTIPSIVSIYSLIYAISKCFIFGTLVAAIGCYMGYTAQGGSRGLARTTRNTAELLIVSLIFTDYLLALFMNFLSKLL